ncbi:MAG: hypothetical protein WCG80_07715 [Spirochaetales bacterium]
MKARLALLLLLFGLCPLLLAYDWPATDVQVTRTFGQRSVGTSFSGIEVVTTDSALRAPEKGDVVFVSRPGSQSIQNLPSALGGFIMLSHEDNLRTVVSRLDPEVAQRQFQRGEPLGKVTVDPGQAESRHRLFVFDQQLGEMVNPLLVYPPLVDKKAPLFLDVEVTGEADPNPQSLFGRSVLPVGYWQVAIDITDPSTLLTGLSKEKSSEIQRGVYAIEAYLNGTELFNTSLDSLFEKGGVWFIKGMSQPLDKVLVDDKRWMLGQVFFNEGNNILEIVVKDFAGNETGKTFRVRGLRN